jgi:hypothetical protein
VECDVCFACAMYVSASVFVRQSVADRGPQLWTLVNVAGKILK